MSPRPLTADSAAPDIVVATAEGVAEGVVVAVVDEAHAEAAGDSESTAGGRKSFQSTPSKPMPKAF